LEKEQPGRKRSNLLWPPLIQGTLVKRYKRFLADVTLADGKTVTAHCANSGSMKTCSDPGMPVYLSFHDKPSRKLKYTWELIQMPSSLVGVNTLTPNRLVYQSVADNVVEELAGYDHIKKEPVVSPESRLDLLLSNSNGKNCYVEIKNCTRVTGNGASFPDAVTKRGLKHLNEMRKLLKQGYRCVMFFLVQRMDAAFFEPADDIDPDYGKGLRRALDAGVEILVYDVDIDVRRICLNRRLPLRL
jgi:sugar fermentation stimulation protein A